MRPTTARRRPLRWLAAIGCGIWLTAAAAPPRPIVAKDRSMTDIPCASDALSRSVCMIRYALDDIGKTSGGVAEGGIADIKAASSTSYTVSLPREERIQTFTYEFAVTSDRLHFVRRTEATQGF